MKIIWSPLAQQRVKKIAEYIAEDNLGAAQKWIHSIYDSVKRLEDFPESGRIVPEFGKRQIREILFGDYRIIYRLDKETVKILTVRHGRQLLRIQELK